MAPSPPPLLPPYPLGAQAQTTISTAMTRDPRSVANTVSRRLRAPFQSSMYRPPSLPLWGTSSDHHHRHDTRAAFCCQNCLPPIANPFRPACRAEKTQRHRSGHRSFNRTASAQPPLSTRPPPRVLAPPSTPFPSLPRKMPLRCLPSKTAGAPASAGQLHIPSPA
jgi:hypothetical protein